MDQGTGSVVPRFVDVFGRLVTVTAATERLLKALRGDPFCGGLLGIFYGFRGVTLQFNSQREELARNRCRRLVRDSLKISTFEAYNKFLGRYLIEGLHLSYLSPKRYLAGGSSLEIVHVFNPASIKL